MNQGKLEVDNKDMERGNIKILGINEQEWARMGEFNSGDMVGKNTWKKKKKGVALIVNKRVQNTVLVCSLKN